MSVALDHYVITAPPVEPVVTLAEIRLWLRRDDVDVTIDDTLIQSLVEAATVQCEKYSNRVFLQSTFDGLFGGLSISRFYDYPFLQIRRSPLVTLSDVFAKVDDSYILVDTDKYELQENSGFARLLFHDVPTVDDVVYPFKVTFDAGYGDPPDVPEDLKTAVKQLVAFWYENRGDVAPDGKQGMPLEVRAILSKYRILNTY